MKRSLLRTLASPFMLLATLAAPLVMPILRHAPCSDDFTFHLLRLTQLESLLKQAVLYSRWAPDMALGYGFPLFNFYAPLSYYLAALIALLTPDLQTGMRLTLGLAIYGSGLAMYLLARDFFKRPAALAAATAYMAAPYLGYDVYFRGNLAESLAWVWLPIALWAAGRILRRGGAVWIGLTAIAYSAVLLTHNVFALIFSPILALYGAISWLRIRHLPDGNKRMLWLTAALFLGIGLATFFWLPALVERELVYSDRLLVPPHFVYWNNFITLGELFTTPQTSFPDLINPSPPRTVGLFSLLLALPALLALRQTGKRRDLVIWASLVVIGASFLMLSPSEFVWANVPLLEFVQFPWRLLGLVALGLALLIGASVNIAQEWLEQRGQGSLAMLCGLLPILILLPSSIYWFSPRDCGSYTNPTVADIILFELQSDTIGTTAKGEYLPRTVTAYPDSPADSPFIWPGTVAVANESQAPLQRSATINASEPFTAVANLFAYPGWQPSVDGEPVPMTPTSGAGLVSFAVPAGRHTLAVQWQETPLRAVANWISLSALLLLVVSLAVRRLWPQNLSSQTDNKAHSWTPTWMVGGSLVLFLLFVSPRIETPLQRPLLAEGHLPAGYTNLNIDMDDNLQLAGYHSEQIGENQWRFDLVWAVNDTPGRPYQSTIRLLDENGLLWSEKDSQRPTGFRTPYDSRQWQPGQTALDSHLVATLPGTPPGDLLVELTLFDKETLLPLARAGGSTESITLATVAVERPAEPAAQDSLSNQYSANENWGDVRLIGYNLDRSAARPGDPFLLTIFWSANSVPTADLMAHITLIDENGSSLWTTTVAPVAGWNTSRWQTGDLWRGQHLWRLPASIPGGLHQWQLQLCPTIAPCQAPAAILGQLQIDEPERILEMPSLPTLLDHSFGSLARLRGLTTQLDEVAGTLAVSLVWEVLEETVMSYRVFVHLMDKNGAILTQSDGEPAGWTRPTTGWLPGEFIIDTHQLSWPAEIGPDTQLAIGIYDSSSGSRLPIDDDEHGERLILPLPR